MKILVVEMDGKRITTFLEFFGSHSIEFANDAYMANNMLSNTKYDIVFLGGPLSDGSVLDVADFINKHLIYRPKLFTHSIDLLLIDKLKSKLIDIEIVPYGTDEFFSLKL